MPNDLNNSMSWTCFPIIDGYFMDEICANCGFTYGSHHGGTQPWPWHYCPGHEGDMDWENNLRGTVFKPTGIYVKRKLKK